MIDIETAAPANETVAPAGEPVDRHHATTKQIRGSSLLLVGRLITVVVNYAVQVVIVRYLTKSDFGAFAYALSIEAFVETLIALGLLVDGNVRVVKVRASQVEPPPEEIVSARTDYVTGVAKREEGLLILLEPEKTLVVKP